MENKKIKEVYKGKVIDLKIIKGKFQGKDILKEIVVFPNTIAILPVIEKGKVVLIKQYRFPIEKEIWELPAGKLNKGEGFEVAAKRELKEETGYTAEKLEKVREFYMAPGYSTEYMAIFRATSLKQGEQALDNNEIINQVQVFSLEAALKMIENKEIIDAKTIIALMYEKDRRKQE
jgi:ADP-ribose pyrophosphatase